MPKVLNKHTASAQELANAVYVGRPSRFGNPCKMFSEKERDYACDWFEANVLPNMDVTELRGKDLVCWCAPKRCHADSLLRKANA